MIKRSKSYLYLSEQLRVVRQLSFRLFFNFPSITIFYRTVCSPRTSPTQLSMFTGLVSLESLAVTLAANAGISLSTVLSVQLPCQLTVLCTWRKERFKIFTASTILRGTVTTSTKERCALDSGLVIVPDSVEVMTPTQAGIQCPGSSLKKFLNLRIKSRDKTSIPA